MYQLSEKDTETLENWRYHNPNVTQKERFPKINDATREAARVILESCPPSAERTLAIRKLQEARMWANASIVLNENGEVVS